MTKLDEPPEGYSGYHEYHVPEKQLQVGTLGLILVLGEFLFPGIVGWFVSVFPENPISFVRESISEVVVILGAIAVHESIHYLESKRRGYSPEFGIQINETVYFLPEVSPYVISIGQYMVRRDNIATLIAPLVTIDALALVGLLPMLPSSVTHFAKVVLVISSAGSIQYVYNVVRIRGMAEGTRFINVENGGIRTFYCVPINT